MITSDITYEYQTEINLYRKQLEEIDVFNGKTTEWIELYCKFTLDEKVRLVHLLRKIAKLDDYLDATDHPKFQEIMIALTYAMYRKEITFNDDDCVLVKQETQMSLFDVGEKKRKTHRKRMDLS